MRFETFQGCAVPEPLIGTIRELAAASGANLNSCDRSPEAEDILRSNGKKSQRQLHDCFLARLSTGRCPDSCGGDCNPANAPGRSTHERRNDGVAYPGPVGLPLRYWQVGMDWSDPAAIIAAARQRGWTVTVTYPDNPRESHHLNLRMEPALRLRPTLQRGSRGAAVVKLTRDLAVVTRPGPYLLGPQRTFSALVEVAVRVFQLDHHLVDDGKVGPVTWRQLAVSVRRERRRRAQERDGPRPLPREKATGEMDGPDVSKWQGDIDWDRVRRAGCEFAVARVADGDLRDPRYSRGRVDAMRSAGLIVGVYYYGRVASPGNRQRDGAAEARMAVGFAKEGGWGQAGDLPLAYDFEEANGQDSAKAARHLLAFVRAYEQTEGHLPIVYTMPGFFRTVAPHLSDDDRSVLRRCPLWVAHWKVERPTVPEPWSEYWCWQHTERGEVAGIIGPCDLNRARMGLRGFSRVRIGR